jgi:hypothetical protein
LTVILAASMVAGAPLGATRPGPSPSKTSNDGKDGCRDGNNGKGNDKSCPTPSPTDTVTPDPTPTETETPPPDSIGRVGFGTRKITPVGDTPDWPPAEWKQFFTPDPETKVWGEPYTDVDGDNCFDFSDPHVDQPWNSTGNAYDRGAFAVDGVTIYGDPQSSGKWDGVWANAGFGAKCTLGMHDDTWARAIVVKVGDKTVAMVSLDVVGFFNIEIQRARQEIAARYPDMSIDELVVSSTHTHEGVDTMGYWGQTIGIDGKFPAYNAFIRSQLIDAVAEGYENLEPAVARFGQTTMDEPIRDSRPPERKDPYLLAAQFVRPSDGSTIGTLVNWSNHPEAQGSNNQLVSSDFPFGTRDTLEKDLGGTSVYFSGSVGGLMTPLREDVAGFGTDATWGRTYEVGRLVAVAAEQALASAPLQGINDLFYKRREFYMQADNTALNGLNAAGVFDIPTFVGANSWGLDGHTEGLYVGRTGEQFKTEMVAVRFGPALFLTVPGELFPEIELGGYGRPDCPAADTGRPYEPVIGEQFESDYEFILGLGQDELGYIVPGYDFWLRHVNDGATDNDGNYEGIIALGALEEEDPCGEGHYEETVSGASTMAAWVACVAAELAGKDPWVFTETPARTEEFAACSYENTHINPYGINPDGVPTGEGAGGSYLGGFEHPPGYYDNVDLTEHHATG